MWARVCVVHISVTPISCENFCKHTSAVKLAASTSTARSLLHVLSEWKKVFVRQLYAGAWQQEAVGSSRCTRDPIDLLPQRSAHSIMNDPSICPPETITGKGLKCFYTGFFPLTFRKAEVTLSVTCLGLWWTFIGVKKITWRLKTPNTNERHNLQLQKMKS